MVTIWSQIEKFGTGKTGIPHLIGIQKSILSQKFDYESSKNLTTYLYLLSGSISKILRFLK